jgi:hypothetical protein
MNRSDNVMLGCWLVATALAANMAGGCASSTTADKPSVPLEAQLVDEGAGQLSHRARSDGRIYLYDARDRAVMDNRSLRRGQEYVAIPNENKALVDDKRVLDKDLKREHPHRLYFLADDQGDRDTSEPDDRSLVRGRIPNDAVRVIDGAGRLTYTAREDGRAYIYDEDVDRVILERDLLRHEQLVLDPDEDSITVNGEKVFKGNLERKHSHRIYFERD